MYPRPCLKSWFIGVVSFSCLMGITGASAQSLENIRASFQDGKVIVFYDLAGVAAGEKYSLQIFGSHNNYSSPLKAVEGDVGDSISAGREKTIIWDAARDLGKFTGEITFKIRGKAMALPFAFISPAGSSTVRRGKTLQVTWQGGMKAQTVTMGLYQGAHLVRHVAETKNNGAYTWQLPGDLAKGTYDLKLMSGSDVLASQTVIVRAKIPMVLKVLPFVAAGGAVVLLTGGDDGGGDTPPGGGSELPGAPGPE